MTLTLPKALQDLGFSVAAGVLIGESNHGCTFKTLFDGLRVTTPDNTLHDLPGVTGVRIGTMSVSSGKVGIDLR